MVVALDPFSLLPLWCFFTSRSSGPPIMATCPPARTTTFDKCNMISGFSTVPTISSVSGDVYIGDDSGNIFALHANGTLKWAKCAEATRNGFLSTVAPPLIDAEEHLYISLSQYDPDHDNLEEVGLLAAVDGKTGKWLWSFSPKCDFSGEQPCTRYPLNPYGSVIAAPVLTSTGNLLFGATGYLYALNSSAQCPK